jgi:hypothetical protein
MLGVSVLDGDFLKGGFVAVRQQRLSMRFSSSWWSARSQMFTRNDGAMVIAGFPADHGE